MIVEIVAGALLGALFVAFARWWRPRDEARIYALGLVGAAIIYVGFALAGGADRYWMTVEFAGLLAFIGFAWLGLRHSLWWLAVGWLAHTAWDTGWHLVVGTPAFVPSWYPVVCIGFDLIVAGTISLRSRARSAVAAGMA